MFHFVPHTKSSVVSRQSLVTDDKRLVTKAPKEFYYA